MSETSTTEIAPTITTQEFIPLIYKLPKTIEDMGKLGIRAVLRFSVPEQIDLTLMPNSPIESHDHVVTKEAGRFIRNFDKRMARVSSPFRVISFVIANPSDVPGEGNNMLAYGEKKDSFSYTRQRVSYLNLYEHNFEVSQSGNVPDLGLPVVRQTNSPFWESEYPDCNYPDRFVLRGLDL